MLKRVVDIISSQPYNGSDSAATRGFNAVNGWLAKDARREVVRAEDPYGHPDDPQDRFTATLIWPDDDDKAMVDLERCMNEQSVRLK